MAKRRRTAEAAGSAEEYDGPKGKSDTEETSRARDAAIQILLCKSLTVSTLGPLYAPLLRRINSIPNKAAEPVSSAIVTNATVTDINVEKTPTPSEQCQGSPHTYEHFWYKALADLDDIKIALNSFASPRAIEKHYNTKRERRVEILQRTSFLDGAADQSGKGPGLSDIPAIVIRELTILRHYVDKSVFRQKRSWEAEQPRGRKFRTNDRFIRLELSTDEVDISATRRAMWRASRDHTLETISEQPALSLIAEWNHRRFRTEVSQEQMESFVDTLKGMDECKPILEFAGRMRRLDKLIEETLERYRTDEMVDGQEAEMTIEELRGFEPGELSNSQLRVALEDERKRLLDTPTLDDRQVNQTYTAEPAVPEEYTNSDMFADVDVTTFMDNIDQWWDGEAEQV